MTAPARRQARAAWPLFTATILVGSFLLFLVQPMVARLALPQLGGAPNVWNSAMLVYQALLLGGYAYAHALGRLALRRQALVHLAALLLGALTLPIALHARIDTAAGLTEVLVPLLFVTSVGPVFFVVSAQAPLMQRWYAAGAGAAAPWALYAASNLGSFAGLVAYPLLAEPLLGLRQQTLAWSLGYGLLVVLVAACAWSRRDAVPGEGTAGAVTAPPAPIPARRYGLWIVLAAVPSGLMLSTTSHLTMDVLATPLLWVIPLALYLLSFVVAFADRRWPARAVSWIAPPVVLACGSTAMLSDGTGTLAVAGGTCLMLLCVAVSLHARLYETRPEPAQLTRFYLAMAAGGALGGLFTALVAPLVFDWLWEHPLLVLAAAALMPLPQVLPWAEQADLDPAMRRIALALLLAMAVLAGWVMHDLGDGDRLESIVLTIFLTGLGLMVLAWRWAFVALVAVLMLAQGGFWTIKSTLRHERTRSYFGVYTVRDYVDTPYYDIPMRILSHGTTLHGEQSLDPAHPHEAMSYYGPDSGAGLALAAAPALKGTGARVGVVGLGTGTLACLRTPGQRWTFFEIDPVVLRYSRPAAGPPKFTYLADCAPRARIVFGDARLSIAAMRPESFDVLAIDAFSSDAIPLHLMTREAFALYTRALTKRGLLLVHVSNRYLALEPEVAAIARAQGLHALKRFDNPADRTRFTPSVWIVLARDPAVLAALAKRRPDAPWSPLDPPAPRAWTDDHASILPAIRWARLLENR